MKPSSHVLLCSILLLAGCRRDVDVPAPPAQEPVDGPFALELPAGFPPLPDHVGAPLTEASVRLGKALFFDARLSRDGTIACASCHFPERAFSDTIALSRGVEGRLGMRNAPPLTNLAWHPAFFRDGGIPTLEQQAIAPIHDPVEMDFNVQQAAALLADEEPYASLSMLAYGERLNALHLVRSLANYQRTLVSGWSRYDRFRQGDGTALSQQERHGMELFNSDALGCGTCHSGHDLTDHRYHNIGLYTDSPDPGRERITLDAADHGRFKTPTLRNIALTAPYMHDGSMVSLEEVVDHFARGGQPAPNKSPLVNGFGLNEQDRSDLVAFLKALTDERPIDQVDRR
jgi:cytochrome c peroxidase